MSPFLVLFRKDLLTAWLTRKGPLGAYPMRRFVPDLAAVRFVHATHADHYENFTGVETGANRDTHFFNPAVQLRTTVIGAEDT